MDKHQLNETLGQLHEELEQLDELDAGSRERLEQLLADIQRLLRSAAEPPEDEIDQEERDSLTSQLEDAVTEFEATYPRFSQLVGRIAYGLGQIGI